MLVLLVAGVGIPRGVAAEKIGAQDSAAIRKLTGKHLTLLTDLPSSSEIDALPGIFDQAVPQWCEYFRLDPKRAADWRITGYLMSARERFETAGLVGKNVPQFKNGYSIARELFLYDQTSPYYRRHLLLHEGTHSFMNTLLGGMGPPWYTEGMAELLATHRLDAGKLTLNYFPRSTGEVPRLGRVEIVQTSVGSGRLLSLGQVLAYDNRAHLENEPYGWCWALAAFLDGHPRYRQRFRELPQFVARGDFSQQFRRLFEPDAGLLAEEWRLFASNLEYGYDFERSTLAIKPATPLAATGANVTIAADRAWQPSSVKLEAGKSYRLIATGRYQVAQKPRPWWCEPGGVTIRYYHGRPLGMLLAAVRPDTYDPAADGLLKPSAIGLSGTLKPEASGTLYLRINDSNAELSDNAGKLDVKVTAE